ncbi:MAG: hypothetical protein M1825_004317 [Sarcosagium campestre]|nr:MAG: hypothetical protein M1825_004317 [Sarcosagium campestre]
MPSSDEPPSSPPNSSTTPNEALAYYKSQYEQLELELAEFQASSKELEAELEKDVDASEKRERQLREKVESLGYEVDEWKSKYKQSKLEANAAQNTLQKEITALRDANRTTQLRLRDIEVANDDFERQARNTTSSLEDLESKYSVAIERAVLLEAEIQVADQEREALRIETQRLKDELSDLRIEAEILQDKLRRAEGTSRRTPRLYADSPANGQERPQSPTSETSPTTVSSSPTAFTPPRKSTSTTASDAPTPPSPPVSEKSTTTAPSAKRLDETPKALRPTADLNTTPRPQNLKSRPGHLRGPSLLNHPGRSTPSALPRTSLARAQGSRISTLPSSGSLRQIRGLIGQMQKLEQRVHSARSKLPAPVNTPPHASPRSSSALGQHIPASVTIRSPRKRTSSSNFGGVTTPLSTQHVNRLSMGAAPPVQRGIGSRPSSRASASSHTSAGPNNGYQRPGSRASMTGARTPLGHYSNSSTADGRRPRSSMGGNYNATTGHNHSASVSVLEERDLGFTTPTARRSTLNKDDLILGSNIPTPSGIPKRQSGGGASGIPSLPPSMTTKVGRRTSSGTLRADMAPPDRRRRLSGVGES